MAMAAITQSGIQANFSGRDFENFQYLVNTNRAMHPGRRSSLIHHLSNILCVKSGLKFLVFFPEGFGVCSLVSYTTDMFGFLIFHKYKCNKLALLWFITPASPIQFWQCVCEPIIGTIIG